MPRAFLTVRKPLRAFVACDIARVRWCLIFPPEVTFMEHHAVLQPFHRRNSCPLGPRPQLGKGSGVLQHDCAECPHQPGGHPPVDVGTRKASLVASTSGRSGGFSLARPAPQITLADVYRAVEDEAVFRMHKLDPEAACPVAAQLSKVLSPPLRAAESAMTMSLQLTTLDDVSQAIH